MYLQQTKYINSPDTNRGGKSIVDMIHSEPYKTIKTAFLYERPIDTAKSKVSLPAETKFKVIDFQGQFIKVEAKTDKGVNMKAWILVEDTNVDINEFLMERLEKNIIDYDNQSNEIIDDFEKIALADYLKKHPAINNFGAIPKDSPTRYQERTYQPFVERQELELAAKRNLSAQFLGDLSKIYSFEKIFDPAKMQADQKLEKNDRKFADARNQKVSFDVGYHPIYEKGEDVHDYLDMGEEMYATMEVQYDQNQKDKQIVDKITLNYPLTYFINNLKYRASTQGQFGTPMPEQIKDKVGLLPIMLAHEYIHTAQNTLVNFSDIAKLPNIGDSKEVERRKTMREILAYHHSIFPNKIYEDPKSDPVFVGTEFIRGKTAVFDQQSDWVQAFLLWMALDYVKRYEATTPSAKLSDKYNLKEIKADFETLRKDLSDRLKINFALGKEAFKAHLIELVKASNGEIVLPDEKISKEDQEILDKQAEEEKKAVDALKK